MVCKNWKGASTTLPGKIYKCKTSHGFAKKHTKSLNTFLEIQKNQNAFAHNNVWSLVIANNLRDVSVILQHSNEASPTPNPMLTIFVSSSCQCFAPNPCRAINGKWMINNEVNNDVMNLYLRNMIMLQKLWSRPVVLSTCGFLPWHKSQISLVVWAQGMQATRFAKIIKYKMHDLGHHAKSSTIDLCIQFSANSNTKKHPSMTWKKKPSCSFLRASKATSSSGVIATIRVSKREKLLETSNSGVIATIKGFQS